MKIHSFYKYKKRGKWLNKENPYIRKKVRKLPYNREIVIGRAFGAYAK